MSIYVEFGDRYAGRNHQKKGEAVRGHPTFGKLKDEEARCLMEKTIQREDRYK